MKILVIDDEKPTLSMFKLFLTAYGYEVFTAENGEEGLALFKEIVPEIVFTDIKMPGIDGLEVLRQIKKSKINTEIIIITGHGDIEKAVEALDLDASDFINKPVERHALNSALARAEKRRQTPKQLTFESSRHIDNHTLAIAITGKLDAGAQQEFSKFFAPENIVDITKIFLKFDDGFSINGSGISLLTDVLRELKHQSVPVVLENLSFNYAKVFQMVGIDKMATLQETISEE